MKILQSKFNKCYLRPLRLFFMAIALFFAGLLSGWYLCHHSETLFWRYIVTAPEPMECMVCNNPQGPAFHAPCLLEVHSGRLTELEIYEPCRRYSGELSPTQDLDYNVMTFGSNGLPLFIGRTKEVQRCVAYLQEPESSTLEPAYYCHECRAKLANYADAGYVLLDLYDLEEFEIYPITEGAEYNMRIYTVSITRDTENNHFVITNMGHLFES